MERKQQQYITNTHTNTASAAVELRTEASVVFHMDTIRSVRPSIDDDAAVYRVGYICI